MVRSPRSTRGLAQIWLSIASPPAPVISKSLRMSRQSFAPAWPKLGDGASGFGFRCRADHRKRGGFLATSYALANVFTQFQHIPTAAAQEWVPAETTYISPCPLYLL